MLRTSGSRGADKMDVLTPVRADECQPVASDDFMDRLWRTTKDELALVVGCAASARYTQQGDEPEQPCENRSEERRVGKGRRRGGGREEEQKKRTDESAQR